MRRGAHGHGSVRVQDGRLRDAEVAEEVTREARGCRDQSGSDEEVGERRDGERGRLGW